MRGAAGELQRQDARAAASKASAAADQLRRAEAGLQGGKDRKDGRDRKDLQDGKDGKDHKDHNLSDGRDRKDLERGEDGSNRGDGSDRKDRKDLEDGKDGKDRKDRKDLKGLKDQKHLKDLQASAGDANGETRQLADALDSLRTTRDELARLQRRLESAARASGTRGQPDTPGGELERAQQDYTRALQRARDVLSQSGKNTGLAGATPEEHEWSWGAPGTEAWKQDFTRWEALGKDLGRALEQSESSVGQRLSKSLARDRLRGGALERVPDGYADRVARYYESLASVVKRQ